MTLLDELLGGGPEGTQVVADQQLQLGVRDLLIGPGTPYCWAGEVADWWGWGTLRTNDTPLPAAHGSEGGRDLLAARTLTGQVLAQATTQAELRALLDRFAEGWQPSQVDVPLVMSLLGEKRRRYGRPRRMAVETQLATRFALSGRFGAVITFQFDALDPLIYGDVTHHAATGTAGATGGFTPPFVPPFTVGAGSASGGGLDAFNAGFMPAPWAAVLTGPLADPALYHDQTGRSLTFTANGGLVLGAGEVALLDSRRQSVLLGGTADRRNNLTLASRWFDLLPDLNGIHFATGSGTGTVDLYWEDAYL